MRIVLTTMFDALGVLMLTAAPVVALAVVLGPLGLALGLVVGACVLIGSSALSTRVSRGGRT